MPTNRRTSDPKRKAEQANIEVPENLELKRSLQACLEEPQQESPKIYGDKPSHLKARHVALKYVRKCDDNEIELPGLEGPMPREVGLIKTVNNQSFHPNILKLHDWFDRPSSYVVAMEHPNPCKDLYSYCQDQGDVLNEDEACNITRQLLGPLQHCEDSGIVHRDVKLENILIQTDTKDIKLIDFGCGDRLKDTPYTEFSVQCEEITYRKIV
ncbi:hypothetical protein JZ751_004223 [Albula glossodonta]|uniref:non-specific serine/threonine protein kinase n=1 Tax=Albula glossodonta TaxID=121402 RepID=A0A8T2N5L9_9TELE|nr:hypothetical protein JZ751_004223 [Albula glossodonta]